jgi:hypothetical protein
MQRTYDELFQASFRVNEPQVVSEEFDGEFVILNLGSGTYYSLQASGNDIWSAVTSGVTPRNIIDAMDAARNPHAADTRLFLEKVIELELVRADAAAVSNDAAAHVVAKLVTINTKPALEVFNDLADLILADPVHEVAEETGWPAPKPVAIPVPN